MPIDFASLYYMKQILLSISILSLKIGLAIYLLDLVFYYSFTPETSFEYIILILFIWSFIRFIRAFFFFPEVAQCLIWALMLCLFFVILSRAFTKGDPLFNWVTNALGSPRRALHLFFLFESALLFEWYSNRWLYSLPVATRQGDPRILDDI